MDDEIGFEKIQIVSADDIVLMSTASTQTQELLAIVVRSGDLVLYGLTHGESKPVVRWIPWFDDVEKKISTIACNPDGSDLLLACYDQHFYVVPALAILTASTSDDDSSAPRHLDVLHLPLPDYIPDEEFVPTALAWWVRQATGDPARHCAIIGSSHGQVVAFSIFKGTVIFTTSIEGCVVRIEVFSKPGLSYIIVTNSEDKQWRITLMEASNKPSDNSLEKKFSSLGLNVVQGKVESRLKKSKNVPSSLKVDLSGEEWIFCHKENKLEVTKHSVGEQRLHVFSNLVVNSYNGNIVTVEKSTMDQVTVHKLPNKAHILAMTNLFFLLTQDKSSSIDVVSRTMSLCKTDTNARTLMSVDFNNDALIQNVSFGENERLLEFFCSIILDQVIILTNQGIYLLRMRKDPHELALNRILIQGNLREAEKISIIFGLDIQRLISEAGATKLSQGLHSEAKQLFTLSLGGSLHHIMALAISGRLEELLENLKDLKLTPVTAALISNMKCLLYIYHILEEGGIRVEKSTSFRIFLAEEEYDAVVALRTLCRVHLFSELKFLMRIRGLHQVAIPALMALVPTVEEDVIKMRGFWELLSDPQLCETLLSREAYFVFHSTLVRKNLASLSEDILMNLEKLYNPFQTTIRNFVANICKGEIDEKMWVKTYILICVQLSSKLRRNEEETYGMISYGHVWEVDQTEILFMSRTISAGFRHAAVVIKGIAYTWGATNNGCLGTGPTTQPVSGPKAVETLVNLQKSVISISCGKSHTIALTNDGVYTWGHNKYSQLGVVPAVESSHPVKIEILSSFNIIDVFAGQYHCLALDDQHRVFSWGWGVHGQLGHGSVEDSALPKIITALDDKGIIRLSAGHAHSLFLSYDGRVFACGNNSFGQLGTIEMKKSSVPIQVYNLSRPVRYISAGHFRNCAVTDDGLVYVWGISPSVLRSAAQAPRQRRSHTEDNTPQYLPMEQDTAWSTQHLTPQLVNTSQVEEPIIKVCEGGEHGIILTASGTIYSYGRNMDGQLGILATLAERRNQYSHDPVPVPIDARILDVACGWNFTIALDRNGKLWSWGAMHHIKGARVTKLASLDGEIVIVNNKNRVLKFPQSTGQIHPVPTIMNVVQLNKKREPFKPAKLPPQLIRSSWRLRMHFAIEVFVPYGDLPTLFEQCVELDELDASSKIALLIGDYGSSVALRLKSTTDESQVEDIVRYFLCLELNDIVTTRDLLHYIITHFYEKKLSFRKLEALLMEYEDRIDMALGSILFGIFDHGKKTVHHFSTSFKVRLTKKLLEQIDQDGAHQLDEVTNAAELMQFIVDGAEEFLDIVE